MENIQAKELFDAQFKFKVNDSVRHKGDNKNGLNSDMGLLVLNRVIKESEDDDGNRSYNRIYLCRAIRYSNSGDIIQFNENELITIPEYNQNAVDEERERERMRNESYIQQREIYEAFGVAKDTKVHLKVNGVADKSKKYRVCGFSKITGETLLILRLVFNEGDGGSEEMRVKSKDDFEIIKSE